MATATCKQCNQNFQHYESKTRIFCSESCRCAFYNHLRAKEKEKKECHFCHNLFVPWTDKTKYCSQECKGLARRKPESERKVYSPFPPRIKQCGVCGISFVAQTNAKFCLTCRETEKLKNARVHWKTEKYKEAHRRIAREWQKSNPEKQKAQSLVKSHPERLKIIYECCCVTSTKHHHHPDYSKPYDVLKLCNKCHAAEHARLRSLQPALAEAI